ncbi:MAG: hypothetical protein Q9184_000265 [Pyrenodesmia sp. 2 TL-2023]
MANLDPDALHRLEIACANGQLDQVRIILQDLEGVRKSKLQAAFHAAVENDQSSVVSLLLSEGFHYDYQSVRTAIKHENIATLQAFFDHKSGINRPLFHTMMPPLAHAVNSEHLVHWFLDRGADPNASVPSWPSPMNAAAVKSSLSVIKILREHGGRANHGVLQSAAKTTESGRVAVLEYLLEEGATIDEVEYEWDPDIFRKHWAREFGTALHHAAKRGDVEMVSFLLMNGARQDIKDSKRRTPVQYAQQNGHDNIVAILEQHQMQ